MHLQKANNLLQTEVIIDRSELETYLVNQAQVNFYHLGDLDDTYWPNTTWYAIKASGEIKAVILFYQGMEPPILLAIDNHNQSEMIALANDIFPTLPNKFYAHISPNLVNTFQDNFQLEHHGEHHKMNLTQPQAFGGIDTSKAALALQSDGQEIKQLFDHSYPGHWFQERMLDTGKYWCLREQNRIVSVAGVHVFSEQYRVAALGNIVTHPDKRGKGFGAIVTAALCKNLIPITDTIGLNVKVDNSSAIAVYKKLGFEVVANYHEYMASQLG